MGVGNSGPELPKEKVQKDKQRYTTDIYKAKDQVTRTLLKSGGELGCSGREFSSYSTSGTRRVNLVTNPVYACVVVGVQINKGLGFH
jgi:hypothetical protein